MIFKAISKHKRTVRLIAAFLALNMVIELVMPLKALALTGGPSQPEVQSFEPVSANQMVDLFTGDFTYNIPLLDVGGYPINISYHAGPGLDEEASWVGLGWNINPGVINRNMRGIPDDFFSPNANPDHADNDYVLRVSKMKPSQTYSLSFSPKGEVFSQGIINYLTLGIEYNNYRGFGYNFNVGNGEGSFPFSVNYSSQGGLGVNVSYRRVKDGKEQQIGNGTCNDDGTHDENFGQKSLGGSIGLSVNSRQGITDLTFNVTRSKGFIETTHNDGHKTRDYYGDGNGSSSITFLNSSYIPSTQNKSFSLSINLSTEIGGEIFGFNGDSRVGIGYNYSGVLIKDREEKYPVYGFLNHSKVNQNYAPSVDSRDRGMAIMDFNANGRNMLTKGQVELPYTTLTYDVLSVSGQGISGIYRPHAGVIGTVYDQRAENIPSTPLSLGFDLAGGNTAKFGVDASLSYFKSESGWWDDDNVLSDHLDYSKTRSGVDFEQVYYKNAGEKTAVDKTFLNSVDDGIAARPELNKSKLEFGLTDKLITSVNDPTITAPVIRNKRDKRNQVISTLSAKEAEKFGLIKYRSDYAKDHHVGQITAVNPDGSRYIYAQPAYNTLQQEYSFSIADRPVDAEGTAWFIHDNGGKDDSEENNSTLEEFFDFQEIPPYAHSYLLNAVVSPDYMDLTGNGPSEDDNGYYTHISYKKVDSIYRWRTPYAMGYNSAPVGASTDVSTIGKYSATFNKGLHSDDEDDKASYIYGEKEIFYIEKIETKTHVALFYTSNNRNDGIDVNSHLGGKGTYQKLHRLDSIALYTINDYNSPGTKKPLKVVYFNYDYSLCKKIPNQLNANSGKLTLKSIYFKYGNSTAGALSPYIFDYRENDASYNPDYTFKGYDRWGNYKAPQSGLNNDEYPYCEQDKALADKYASAWSLHKITLPSGGTITVHYETDDYAYVQDKKAMEMFKIVGFNNKDEASNSPLLYWDNGFKQNDYVIFKRKSDLDDIKMYLPEPSPIDNKRYLYINAYVKLKEAKPLWGEPAVYDFVRCYAEIIGSGVCTNDDDYGFIQIKGLPINETLGIDYGNINPLAKTAWQFMRLNAPHLVYEGQNAFRGKVSEGAVSLGDLKQTAWAIFGFLPELARTFAGFNTQQILLERAKEIDLAKSWIRLQSPNQKKIGGGLRVKKILISNEWHGMVPSEESQTLGQVYQYTMYDSKRDDNNNTVYYEISSGVASYEPQLGGDENPHRLPEFYTLKKMASLGQEDYFFHDIPLGESVYPAPNVGYRQVLVRNIKPHEDDDPDPSGSIKRHGTGYSVHKFYTAYDYPVIKEKTTVDAAFRKNPITSLLGFSTEIVGASQGFSIEINDMHGKPRGVETYDEYNKFISGTTYNYKSDGKRLSNTVATLKEDGSIDREAIVGYEVEMVVHPRQLKEGSITVKLNTDADVFFAGPIPVITLGIGLGLQGMYKSVRTATATKIINRYGILESVVVTDQSSSVETKNIAFDDETGEVLLTETTNEYSDKVYNFTYPSHWTVDGMGHAYKNIGAYFTGVSIGSSPLGKAVFNLADGEFLIPGDELIADNGTTPILAWVLDKELISSQYHITFIDRLGNPLPSGTYTMRNIRSGRRNMQTVPVGKIVGKSNPIPTSGSSFFNMNGEVNISIVLNASAASFSDQWQVYRHDPGCWIRDCDNPYSTRGYNSPLSAHYYCFSVNPTDPAIKRFPKVDEVVNPFVAGIKGNWRPDYTYVYYDRRVAGNEYEREQVYTGTSFNSTNTANDGNLKSFKPFWYVSSGEWVNRGVSSSQVDNPWTWNSLATQINPDGVELENKNALDIFSSAIYSYTTKQPLAVTYNAPLRETLFEGFEDYPFMTHDVLYCDPEQLSNEITVIHPGNGNNVTKLVTTPVHWYFWPALHNYTGTSTSIALVSDDQAHTGKNSLKITNSYLKVPTKIYAKSPNSNNTGLINQYLVNPVDLTDIFSPNAVPSGVREEYLLTYWIKTNSLDQAYIEVKLNNSTITPTSTAVSNKIEGWIKVEQIFILSNVNVNDVFDVVITNTATAAAYFDDIRIHPLDANMKSFVYDNTKLRLSASLDENNYATLFEYDEEGNLVRTKRETERGIITINENRQNIQH